MSSSSPLSPEGKFPMRINKYLSFAHYSTRRGGDELVAQHRVFINGHKALLGDKVKETDNVEVRTNEKSVEYVYIAYNKPLGVITHSPQEGEKDIRTATKNISGLADCFPIGRLDKNSHGLILLTNDGRITDRLLNPKYAHEKEYRVVTREPLRPSFQKNMERGVKIEGEHTRPCTVKVLSEYTFRIILSEGKKHQIRRMVSAMHNEVADLERKRIMNIELGSLKRGEYRAITGTKLTTFLTSLGLEG